MKKGGIILPEKGLIQVRAYTGVAELPLEDVAVTITTTDNVAVAMRLTDSSGRIEPVEIDVPPLSDSQSPNPNERPFAVFNLFARKEDFEQINIYGLQAFSGVTTEQNLEFVPFAEFPEEWDDSQSFDTPPQNL